MFILSLFLDGFDDSFLELTQEEVYEEVLEEVDFGTELENWFASEKGYSCESEVGPCKKSLVLMNLDKEGYVGDNAPDEVIHDVFSNRLTDPKYNVRLLERDRQGLNLIYSEINEIELPELLPDPQSQEETEITNEAAEQTRLTELERQEKIGSLIEDISAILAPQDNLFFTTDIVSAHEIDDSDDGDESQITVQSPNELENIQLSNEVGERKSELLKYLVDQYISVYSCESGFCQEPVQPELPEIPQVEVEHADYLLAYKIKSLDDQVDKDGRNKIRQTNVKMHARIINVQTGEIEVADTLEKTITRRTDDNQPEKKEKVKKEYTPYSSLEMSLRPHAPKLDVLQDPPTSLTQFYLSGHSYSKKGYRGSLGIGFGLNNDTNENVGGGDTIDSGTNMLSFVGSVDKILFADKAVKMFLGTGVNYSSLNADENVKGRTIEDANGGTTTESDSYFQLKSDEVYAFANLGLMYSYNRWAIEVGYQLPYTSLYTNSSIAINENNDLLANSYVPPSTVRIGVHYSFCGTLPLPAPFSKGSTCNND